MANYGVRLQRTASTTASLGNVTAGATLPRRIKILDFSIGSEGTPADNAFTALLQRCTTTGTSTAVTPQAKDPADQASVAVAGQNHTIEPTYTANAIMFQASFNQRSWIRWIASPGDEIVIPATSSNGIGCQTPTSAAVAITAYMSVQEQ